MKIAVTGASGFIGLNLIKELSNTDHEIFALSRSPIPNLPPNVNWRHCELFSAQSTLDSLIGIDIVYYLVHSMMPSSRLFQGNFHDSDLLIADNLSRSCQSNRVNHIIYLGGIIPEGFISQHLQSRREVEGVLQSSGIPVTVLRSGMIVGSGGSSFEILKTLVKNLPAMILPQWTTSKTQAIYINDIVAVLIESIRNSAFKNKVIDLVNGEKLNYRDLMVIMAKALKVKRLMIPVPLNSTGFSKLWVTWFGNSNYSLVSPLIDSLLCDLPQPEMDPLIKNLIQYTSFERMINEVLKHEEKSFRKMNQDVSRPKRKIKHRKSVRSIQRLPSLTHQNSDWIAREYMRWLPHIFRSLIRVDVEETSSKVAFRFSFWKKPLLELQYIAGNFDEDRQKFHIIGGFLSKTGDTGWLEFRQVQNKMYTLTAIHEFVPSLPWYIYILTQAPIHRLVMLSFGRHLKQFQKN
ncbi:NAD-dependent epimerase/dehydratase family protein [Leptospira sp. GIMC2001]|uniref:NAD-dependent epimerase/dehydratase family protein n=1 Tax=Leptospira sp. GIMC2001 TaxID=1513297 RepID=UPI0023492F04|nr:NAD-dependent epimerase/dehydratase family protein [Leptospira sp. GIMC2001]WCL49756.1 NAD(P)H-binding protein [Leptospira sp. GIMC2001]